MAYSYQSEVSDGTLQRVILSIPFYNKEDIHVYVEGRELSEVDGEYRWEGDVAVYLRDVVPVGESCTLRRITDMSKLRLKFSEGVAFTRNNLDDQNSQFLHMGQEAKESALSDIYGDIDMHHFRIRNASDPELPSDYTTKRWVDNTYTEAVNSCVTSALAASNSAAGAASSADSALDSATRAEAAAGVVGPQVREALSRSYAEVGYNLVDGSFEKGGILVKSNDVLLHELSGKAYTGEAGVVPAGTDPLAGGFTDRSKSIWGISTLADLATTPLGVGSTVKVTDRGGSDFVIELGTSPNGFDTVPAGSGQIARLVIENKTIDCTHLGMKPNADNKNALLALNALIMAGKVNKVLMSAVYNTSDEYTVPSPPFSISYIGLAGGLKPTLSGLKFTHNNNSKHGWVLPSRHNPWHLENLCSIGGGTRVGLDGFTTGGVPAANCTAKSLYSKNWGRDGFYINNLFICRFDNLMSEDTGRDGIHLNFANEIQMNGYSVERAARWGINNEDGYINTGTGNCSDCGTGGTGGALYVAKGASNSYRIYYEAVAAGRSRTCFSIGNKAIDTRIEARLSKYDTWTDDGVLSKITITGQGVFDVDPRTLALNINNPCFEVGTAGTGGWITNQGAVTLSRVNEGYSGNYSLRASITGTSGNANFYTNGAGYNYNVSSGQTVYVSFAIKTSRDIGVNAVDGEHVLVEFIGLSSAEPTAFNAVPVTKAGKWRKVTMAMNANETVSNVRLRFVLSGLTSNVDIQITDVVFTTSLVPAKVTPRPNSTATDINTIRTDFNALLAQLRNVGIIARN